MEPCLGSGSFAGRKAVQQRREKMSKLCSERDLGSNPTYQRYGLGQVVIFGCCED